MVGCCCLPSPLLICSRFKQEYEEEVYRDTHLNLVEDLRHNDRLEESLTTFARLGQRVQHVTVRMMTCSCEYAALSLPGE